MQATVLVVFGDLFVRLSVFAMVHALASLWIMHNTRMEKQTNLINTFKMTMIFPFFIFESYLTVKRIFFGDLDLLQNKSPPNCFVMRKHYKTRYYMILLYYMYYIVTFIVKF